ncbi:MAG: PKD domain-containing protein, partial [bacterium]|nr:PKD domain-containing protein [bacterium]
GRVNLYNAVNTGPPPAPVADFSGSPISGTEPLSVTFTDLSTGTIDTWSWTFGDGGTSTAQNPSYTFNSAGTYDVTLTVTGPGGSDAETKIGYITVNPCVTPTAGFVGSPVSGDYPLTVNFTDQSTNATSYSWSFGDGGTSTAANPSYTYTTAGTFTVTQTVTNSCGSDQMVRTAYITVTEPPCDPPVADFNGSPTSGTEPLTVNFSDLSTNSPTSWSWTFGEGGTSTAQNPSYVYNTAGTYTVTMTATNSCGSDVATKVDYITVDPSTSSQARALSDISVLGSFTGSYLSTYTSDNNYEVITEALSTSHPRKVTSNAEHKWNFNVGTGGGGMMFYVEAYRPSNSDGDDFIFEYSTDDATYVGMVTVASATEQVYSFAMPAGLTGTVYVRVRDSDRAWDLTSLDAVYVDDMYIEYSTAPTAPTAEFAGTPVSGFTPLTVNFGDLSTGAPTSWSWTFGDGGTSTAQNPSYTYNAVGTYTVSLTATNSYGSDTNTKTNYITVSEPGSGESHVAAMVVGRVRSGASYSGTCTVTIFDETNAPLSNATVYVTYDGPNSGNLNGVTAGDGTVDFSTPLFKKPTGEWCFEVTDVTHATYTYNSAANVVTRACESGPVYKNGHGEALPTAFSLDQNYPNPFNPSTMISFALPTAGHAKIEIYNLLGKRVDVLADGHFNAGYHTVVWDGSDQASGIYFYRLTASDFAESKKMLLIK